MSCGSRGFRVTHLLKATLMSGNVKRPKGAMFGSLVCFSRMFFALCFQAAEFPVAAFYRLLCVYDVYRKLYRRVGALVIPGAVSLTQGLLTAATLLTKVVGKQACVPRVCCSRVVLKANRP